MIKFCLLKKTPAWISSSICKEEKKAAALSLFPVYPLLLFQIRCKKQIHEWTAYYLGRLGRAGKNKSFWCFFPNVPGSELQEIMEGKGNTATIRSLAEPYPNLLWLLVEVPNHFTLAMFYGVLPLHSTYKEIFHKTKGWHWRQTPQPS